MWKRFVKFLHCPMCSDPLELSVFQETYIKLKEEYIILGETQGCYDRQFNHYIDAGLLLCHNCQKWFPIVYGLPVLLPYVTSLHKQFTIDFNKEILELPVAAIRFLMEELTTWRTNCDGFILEGMARLSI